MIPGTLLGLLLFAAGIGPGYIYVWVAERYELRPSRSPLLEAAQLIIVGALASIVAALIVLSIAEWRGWVDTSLIAADPGKYLVTEPVRSLSALLAILLLSYGTVWGVAWLIHRGKPKSVRPGDPAWHVAFSRDCPDGMAVAVTVELTDGRTVTGSLRSYSVGTDEAQDLTLIRPLTVRQADGTPRIIPYEFFLVSADQIKNVSGNYRPGAPYRADQPPRMQLAQHV